MSKNQKINKTWIIAFVLMLIVGTIGILTIIRNLNTEIEIHSGTWEMRVSYELGEEVKDVETTKLIILDESFFDFEYTSKENPETDYSYNGSYTWEGNKLLLSYFYEGKAYEDIYYLNSKNNNLCKDAENCELAFAKNSVNEYKRFAPYEKKYLTPEQYQEKIANKDTFMLVVHADWCSACASYAPEVVEAIGNNDPEVYYISDRDAKLCLTVSSYPTTFIYEEGVQKEKFGYQRAENLKSILIKYKLIKEEVE